LAEANDRKHGMDLIRNTIISVLALLVATAGLLKLTNWQCTKEECSALLITIGEHAVLHTGRSLILITLVVMFFLMRSGIKMPIFGIPCNPTQWRWSRWGLRISNVMTKSIAIAVWLAFSIIVGLTTFYLAFVW
jgi:hypothetical protein